MGEEKSVILLVRPDLYQLNAVLVPGKKAPGFFSQSEKGTSLK